MFQQDLKRVENKWLRLLYERIKELFSHTWLPSHDHTHHHRVWQHAKKLAGLLHEKRQVFSTTQLEQLIIAVFFHDTGLVRTMDATHGMESSRLCRDFLLQCATEEIFDFEPILQAVEKHDDKSYGSDSLPQRDHILALLSAADDLDAFGAIGVFRYLEIYWHRGIPLHSLAGKVINNLDRRIDNLRKQYLDLHEFVNLQDERCLYTEGFYRDLNKQLQTENDSSSGSGPLLAINTLLKKVLREKVHFTVLTVCPDEIAEDAYASAFFKKLHQELKAV